MNATLISLSAKLAQATSENDVLSVQNQLTEFLIKQVEPRITNETTDYLRFTKKEIANMSKTFKNEFIAHGCVARITKRPSGKLTFCYEIRYRRNGFDIAASSTDIEEAKKKFADATHNALQAAQAVEIVPVVEIPTAPLMAHSELAGRSSVLFSDVATEWFKHRHDKIFDTTYDAYQRYYNRYLLPALYEKEIRQVSAADINEIMATIHNSRLYKEVRSVLNQIFKYAIGSGLLMHNPVALIPFENNAVREGKHVN